MARKPPFIVIPHDVAYKGYLIRKIRDQFAISKDGYHIGWVSSLEKAKADIDLLA